MTVTLPDASRDPRTLVKLLGQQRDLYLQLKTLSDQQASLIVEGQTEQLLSLLGHRQRLVDALTRLNKELNALRSGAGDLQSHLSEEERVQVRALMSEVDGLLHAIIAQDDRDRRDLQSAQQKVGSQLRHVARGGMANNAYRGAPVAPAARFTDRQC